MRSDFQPNFIDTHCHLNFSEFDHDRASILERSKRNGISKIVVPGIDIQTSVSAINLAQEYPEAYAAVGIHPNSGVEWTSDSLSTLKKLAKNNKVVAIGEIGLDYYRGYTPKDIQKSIFMKQLDLAAELNLPVIIHNRDASNDIVEILREWKQSLGNGVIELAHFPGVLHSFSGDEWMSVEVVSLNFFIGITGSVTFLKSRMLQTVVEKTPIKNLLIETDSPYQTPVPFRGKRNEPANVRIVGEKIAVIKEMALVDVAGITTANADHLLRWRDHH